MAMAPTRKKFKSPVLIADIGGTFVRFALVGSDGRPGRPAKLRVADYPGPAAAARNYLASVRPSTPPRRAVLAVAGPIAGGRIAMTNHPWRFTLDGVAHALALDEIEAINDFQAAALAVPGLGPRDRIRIGRGRAQKGSPIAVLGPGTGLGVSALIATPGGAVALASEGGHATLAATDAREAEVLDRLRRRFGHVSAERVLSGPGLANLYRVIADERRYPSSQPDDLTPAEVVERAGGGNCPVASEAIRLFSAFLGGFAGNLALVLGARGGVYLAGGILPRIDRDFARSPFRARFEAKGRFQAYLARIPTYLITRSEPALIGLAARAAGR